MCSCCFQGFAHLADPRRRAVEDALLLRRRQPAVQRQQPQRTAAVAQLRQRPRLLQRADLQQKQRRQCCL